MPIHDWTRLEPGDFHHFHQRWVSALADALNGGHLPPEYMALVGQVTGRPIPDVVALAARPSKDMPGGVAVTDAPPAARTVARLEKSPTRKRRTALSSGTVGTGSSPKSSRRAGSSPPRPA